MKLQKHTGMIYFISLIIMLLNSITIMSAVISTNSQQIARVTGATPSGEILPNPNNTSVNYAVFGTDLGIMWDKGEKELMCVFGDTYGTEWGGNGAGPETADWRSNVLGIAPGVISPNNLTFSSMIIDKTAHAKELLPSAHDSKGNGDFTNIPTAGITINKRHYIHFMNIKKWGAPGTWETNYSTIAYSDDNGKNWTKADLKWNSNSKFAQVAFVKYKNFVYMFGTPAGRLGGIYLARVPKADILKKAAYQYWDGSSWNKNMEDSALQIVPPPVGELSVVFNSHFERWIMTYLNEKRAQLVLRDSASLTGPWTGEKILVKGKDFPGLYGAFIYPFGNNGDDLFFNMSIWGSYNVFLMHATLNSDGLKDNILSDPGFEDQSANTVSAPWTSEGTVGIDHDIGNQHSGQNNIRMQSISDWNCIKQQIAVTPKTQYCLSGWIKTSPNLVNGHFGVREISNNVFAETKYGKSPSYAKVKLNFNSASNKSIEVFAGFWANGNDTWAQLDDFFLAKTEQDINMIEDPGFEKQTAGSVSIPWSSEGIAGIDHNLGFQHSGINNVWLRSSSGWNCIKQQVQVEPNTNYTLTGWIRTSDTFLDGYFGVREVSGSVIEEVKYGNLPNYSKLDVLFDSGSNSLVEIFVDFQANDVDTWAQIDDLLVTPITYNTL